MSDKLAAATHGAPVEARLLLHAPYSEDGDIMREAADTIRQLRPVLVASQQELEGLPNGIVVRSKDGTIATRYDSTRGVIFGDERTFPWKILGLPVTVLWQP